MQNPIERANTNTISDPKVRWLVLVLLIELLIAVCLPSNVLDRMHFLKVLTDFAEGILPVVGQFDQTAREPQVVRVFLTVTFLLMPIKVAYWLSWLHSDYLSRYRDYVISPLTVDQPTKTYGLVGPLAGAHQQSRTRSMASRITWSLAAIALCSVVWLAVVYKFGDPAFDQHRGVTRSVVRSIRSGEFWMWLGWSVGMTSISLASTAAMLICILRDYFVFFRGRFRAIDN